MTLLFILFIAGTILLLALLFIERADTTLLPWTCPRCYARTERTGGVSIPWYLERRGGVRCRMCRTAFKEHPNGTLVEDR